MAQGSRIAQGLQQSVTSIDFIVNHYHTLILLIQQNKCLGIHKVGMKHLFQYDSDGQAHELDAFCCLDFYVHESQQRKGLGRLLFAVAESLIGIPANYWGFDKPSPKLFAFLEKYYGMKLKPEFSR